MKILIATGLYPPEIGGPATYSKILVERLPEHDFSVSVLPFSSVRRFPRIVRHFIYFFYVLKSGYKKDYVVALDPVSVGLPTALASILLRKKYIVRIAGDYAWERSLERTGKMVSPDEFVGSGYSYPLNIKLLKKVEYFVASYSSAVIVPSKYLKSIISEWGIPKDKIHVIYNSVKDLHEQGNVKTLRSLIHFDGKIIMTAGRLISLKRFDELIRLMPSLKKKFGSIKLFVAGDGPQLSELEKLASELGVSDEVVFSGALEQSVLFRYIKMADIFVLNSIHETFSHILLEALSIGTPAVATNVGGNPEIIEDGVSGVLVSSGNSKELEVSISKVLSDEVYSWKLSRGGRKRAEGFKEERAVSEFVELLKSI